MTQPERRAFLRATSAIAAAAAMSLPAMASARSGTPVPVSLLLPQPEERHPARDAFLTGFQSAIRQHALPLTPVVVPFSGSVTHLPETLRAHLSRVSSAAVVGLLSRHQASLRIPVRIATP